MCTSSSTLHLASAPYWCCCLLSHFECIDCWACPGPAHFCPQNYQFMCEYLGSHVIHASLVPLESTSQTASPLIQLFLHSTRQRVPVRHNGPPHSLSRLPVHIGDLRFGLPSNTCFLGPTQIHSQTAWRLVQPLLQGSRLQQTNWPCFSTCSSRPHLTI